MKKILLALTAVLTAAGASAQTLPYRNAALSPAERARDLVGRMTLEEKVSQMQNAAPAIPRLGIERYDWWSEALHGIGRAGLATVFPQSIGMAATFDVPLVERVFTAVSDEATIRPESSAPAHFVEAPPHAERSSEVPTNKHCMKGFISIVVFRYTNFGCFSRNCFAADSNLLFVRPKWVSGVQDVVKSFKLPLA